MNLMQYLCIGLTFLCTFSMNAQVLKDIQLSESIQDNHDHPWSGKMDNGLLVLQETYQQNYGNGAALNWSDVFPFWLIEGEYVAVEILQSAESEELKEQLKSLGALFIQSYRHVHNAYFPISNLSQLPNLTDLQYARVVRRPYLKSGVVTSQGDQAQQSDEVRSRFGLSGNGIKVGVLSDSFDDLGGAASGVINKDLPGFANPDNPLPVDVVQEAIGSGFSDEGRAMLEIIHDVAPKAALAFHTALGGLASFANGILALEQADCDIILDDIGYFDDAFFQDGIVSQAVDEVVARGKVYLSAAGNQARTSYEDDFVNAGTVTVGGVPYNVQNFGNGDILQQITVGANESVTIVLQWDQPFLSVTGTVGSASDLDLFLIDEAGATALLSSTNNNIGNDAIEILQFTNNLPTSQVFNLLIGHRQGPIPTLIKYLVFGNVSIDEFATNSATCVGQPNAAGALAVGAAFWAQTPPFGSNPPILEPFSSGGGTPILFDITGNPISPTIRIKPDFVAPDGGDTSFFGTDINDAGSFPNFFGTSAAAPHAAGVVALLMEAQPAFGPVQVKQSFQDNAIDMLTPGPDLDSGAGLIDAVAIIEASVAALPVELVIFDGTLDGQEVLLEWQTATETDNSHFEIEKAVDGGNFEKIGQVLGAGNAIETINYEFIDRKVNVGTNYYRLKQVDYDGRFTHSTVIAIDYDESIQRSNFTVFPNPIKNQNITLNSDRWEGFATMQLVKTSGQLVWEGEQLIEVGAQTLSLSVLKTGKYLLRIIYEEEIEVLTIIKS